MKTNERDKLLNLGLNYFVACTGIEAEQAMVFMGDSLATAPAPKDFKSTLEFSPANASSATPYQVWATILEAGGPGDTTWQNKINNGYTSMNALYGGSSHPGVHGFISGAEYRLNDPAFYSWAEYIANSVHINAAGVPATFETDYLVNLDQFLLNVPNLDILEHYSYPFNPVTLPYRGAVFQDSLQETPREFSEAATAIKNRQPGTPFYAIVQAHSSTGGFRAPTKAEILCQINLALAYGAKGIVYYLYAATSTETGLLTASRDTTSRYNFVKDIHNNYQSTSLKLVDIGANFLPLAWQAGFSIHQNTNEPISSTYKLYDVTAKIPGGATDAETETYIEVGVLQSDSINHYMVVNRRCTSTESREITMTFQCTSANAYLITDIFTGDQKRFLLANATTITYTFTLGPGQGKLLKLEDLGNWTGSISSNTTWSGTVCANSNITVNSGVTLTIAANTKVLFLTSKKLTVNGGLKRSAQLRKISRSTAAAQAARGAAFGSRIPRPLPISIIARCETPASRFA